MKKVIILILVLFMTSCSYVDGVDSDTAVPIGVSSQLSDTTKMNALIIEHKEGIYIAEKINNHLVLTRTVKDVPSGAIILAIAFFVLVIVIAASAADR